MADDTSPAPLAGRWRRLPEPVRLEACVPVVPVGWAAVAAAPLAFGLDDPLAGGGLADADGD